MKRFPTICAWSLAAVAFGLSGCSRRSDEAAKPPVVVKASDLPRMGPAPAWKLKDLNGRTVSLEELRGKVVVLDFWATWCGPCRFEIPGYIEMHKKYANEGL